MALEEWRKQRKLAMKARKAEEAEVREKNTELARANVRAEKELAVAKLQLLAVQLELTGKGCWMSEFAFSEGEGNDLKVKVNACDSGGNTLLHHACRSDDAVFFE